MIAIVDCNSFYCSCETVFKPQLEGKPVIVLSNNDGCVIARNKEAKALGVAMGEPYFKREKYFKENSIAVFSSNYTLYGDLSQRVMDILSTFTPEIEYYSIDEAFLDLSGFNSLNEYVHKIRNTIRQYTGIPVSIGVAPTKTLSKIANKISKKNKSGCLVLDTEEKITEALKSFSVSDIWGIGGAHNRRLNDLGIYTALQLRELPEEWVYKNMSVVGLRLVRELKGIQSVEFEYESKRKKGICSSRQFGKIVESLDEIKEGVAFHAGIVSNKLRKDKSACNLLTVFIHTNPFNEKHKQYSASKVIQLPVPTSNTAEIVEYSLKALKLIYKKGYKYNKTGVIATGIVPEDQIQASFLDDRNREKDKNLMKAFDKVNNSFGKGSVRIASEGFEKKWSMKRNMLSPSYTTKWSDILIVNL